MPTVRYTVTLVAGLKTSDRRAIAFLSCDGNCEINAEAVFKKLKPKEEKDVRARFDHWIDGGVFKKYHHGWDESPNKECYVFKRQDDRFYGFLCHPRPNGNPRFQACILVCHGLKGKWETDPKKLALCNTMRAIA